MRILVIDDDEKIREMIGLILAGEGHELLDASNGNEGLKLLEKHASCEVVITDMLMPEKEGIETIREIRRKFPRIRILAISGGGICIPESYLSIALALGANAILSKPFGKDELLLAIDSLKV